MDPLDPAWAHCDNVKGLRSTMICRYCHKRITGGGITRFKYHLAGIKGRGKICDNVPEHVKIEMARLINGGSHGGSSSRKEAKKGKKKGRVTLAFLKAHVKSKKIRKDKVSTKKSEVRSKHSSPQSGSGVSPGRQIQTRSCRDKKLDTHIFECLMEDLWKKISEEKRKHCIYFDSLWFSSYQDDLRSKDKVRKSKILKWIKNKNVFSKKYVFVPIVRWGHWSLLILCHFGDMNRSPCMLLLDSLLDAGPKRLESDIRRFVTDIYKISGREEDESFVLYIPFLIPKVPQQTDAVECGTCVLYFTFRFIESAPDTISLDKYPYFLTEEWFTREEFEKFARELELSSKEKKEKKEQQHISDNVDPRDEIKIRKKTGTAEKSSSDEGREETKNNEASNSERSRGGELSNGTSDSPSQSNSKGNKKTDGVRPTLYDDMQVEGTNGNVVSSPRCRDVPRPDNNQEKGTADGPVSSDNHQGDSVIGSDKTVYSRKQNSSSCGECFTEGRDTVTKEQPWLLLSQNSVSAEPNPDFGLNITILLKNSPIWQSIHTLEVFKQIPQRPHFRKLESYCPEAREGMAIGLMVTYASLVESVEKLSYDDDATVFQQKISCLDTLEENGFNVGPLRSRVKRLLQINTDHTLNCLRRAELQSQLAQKESANTGVLLDLDKAELELRDLRNRVNYLTEERSKLVAEQDRLLNLTAGLESEIPRLKDQICNVRRLRESARETFEKLIAEPL